MLIGVKGATFRKKGLLGGVDGMDGVEGAEWTGEAAVGAVKEQRESL
jgi:hypothetical protein